jgi:hypothetical protein
LKAAAQFVDDIEADILQRGRIAAGALQDGDRRAGFGEGRKGLGDFVIGAHTTAQQHRLSGCADPLKKARRQHLPRRHLPGRHPDFFEQLQCAHRKSRADEAQILLARVR